MNLRIPHDRVPEGPVSPTPILIVGQAELENILENGLPQSGLVRLDDVALDAGYSVISEPNQLARSLVTDPDDEKRPSREYAIPAIPVPVSEITRLAPSSSAVKMIGVKETTRRAGRTEEEIDFKQRYGWKETMVVGLGQDGLEFRELTEEVKKQLEAKRDSKVGGGRPPRTEEGINEIVTAYCRQMQGITMIPMGSGGMAQVYEATRIGSSKPTIAVKRAKRGLEASLEEEFGSQLRAAHSELVPKVKFHVNILYDDMTPVASLLGMELVSTDEKAKDGLYAVKTLEDYLQVGTIEKSLMMLQQVLIGIDEIAQGNQSHRDIKPSNILIADEENNLVRITDFGIAKELGEPRGSLVQGTPQYISPQTMAGIGKRSIHDDLYAAGVILHTILTGDTPFGYLGRKYGNDLTGLFDEMVPHVFANRALDPALLRWYADTGQLTAIELSNRTNLSASEKQVINKALAYSPEHRYQSGAEMAVAIEGLLLNMSKVRKTAKVGSVYHGNDHRIKRMPNEVYGGERSKCNPQDGPHVYQMAGSNQRSTPGDVGDFVRSRSSNMPTPRLVPQADVETLPPSTGATDAALYLQKESVQVGEGQNGAGQMPKRSLADYLPGFLQNGLRRIGLYDGRAQ